MNNTVIISGVTGQLGSYLADIFINDGFKVIGLKRRTSTINSTIRINHLLKNSNFNLKYFDLNDTYSIYNLFNNIKPDFFFHCAAMSHVRISFDLPNETLQTNIIGTLNIINAIKELSPKTKFLNLSSSEMFGQNKNFPFTENSVFMPVSPYAISKVASHELIKNYRNSYNLFLSNAICFNYESPRRGENFVTKKITLEVAKIKNKLSDKIVLGNIKSYRDWSYAKDIAEGCKKILEHNKPDDFILCSGETHSVEEFLEEVFNLAEIKNWNKHVEINPIYFRPQEVPYLLGDSSKAKQVLGWEPKIKFKELAKIMYDFDVAEIINNGK